MEVGHVDNTDDVGGADRVGKHATETTRGIIEFECVFYGTANQFRNIERNKTSSILTALSPKSSASL